MNELTVEMCRIVSDTVVILESTHSRFR